MALPKTRKNSADSQPRTAKRSNLDVEHIDLHPARSNVAAGAGCRWNIVPRWQLFVA